MTAVEQEYLDKLAEAFTERVLANLNAARDDRPLLTVKEAAERLGISEKSMRDLINEPRGRKPRIRSVVIGDGARRIEPAEIDVYLAERRGT